ncbi:hypothetical protein L1077_19895 [Pseudoalteromonas luteoviolacea]|uniref:hypothetical protein n=1 Tax=Pseudoalteromonas luteoviolacea TaxID=43657 RepID=UPI001F326F6F|nr:hypothetical protein [Pseudoalteromonas luteoviolacea]MCF6441702.1 hypothetical protein [Pseudoalteromonas luteoviolacea]
MITQQGLLLKQLVLVGHRKDYTVTFNQGVNIIYGDADTGKSSILRVVYYLLGGKTSKLDHEITSSVKYAVLEIEINSAPYCIIRDLYNSSKDVDVYSCPYAKLEENFPEKYASSVTKSTNEKKSLSDFLLEELNFPIVKLKQAPTKDNSETARLSFLDLFKYMYLNQDDVGSTHMLNIGNPVVEVKNREVLKYIFNVLDTNISDLEVDISTRVKEKSDLESQYRVISKFLSEIEFDQTSAIDEEITLIDELKEDLERQLKDLNNKMVSNNKLYSGLKEALDTINLDIKRFESVKSNAERNIERFSRLSNDYLNDIQKLKAAAQAKVAIGKQKHTTSNCPICDNTIDLSDVSEEFDISQENKLKQELNSIVRRSKDLTVLIADNRKELEETNKTLSELYKEQFKAKEYIDEELASSVTPFLAERDVLVKENAKLGERREKYLNALKVRNRQRSIAEHIGRLESNITQLKGRLEEMLMNSPSMSSVLSGLATSLDLFLQNVKINNQFGVSVSEKSFLPIVRNIEYRNINSGGLRTITSIGYLASIMGAKLNTNTNLPSLMMIDTVGKFLGKTPEDGAVDTDLKADEREGVSDPDKYKNLFESLLDLAERFEENGKLCQIILVDNDLPPEVAKKHSGFEIAHYRSNGVNNLPIGLIDDWEQDKK